MSFLKDPKRWFIFSLLFFACLFSYLLFFKKESNPIQNPTPTVYDKNWMAKDFPYERVQEITKMPKGIDTENSNNTINSSSNINSNVATPLKASWKAILDPR